MKNNKALFEALGNITQLGLNVIISFLLWIFIASWIKSMFSLGNGIMVAGIILGTGSAVMSFIKYIQKLSGKEKKDGK